MHCIPFQDLNSQIHEASRELCKGLRTCSSVALLLLTASTTLPHPISKAAPKNLLTPRTAFPWSPTVSGLTRRPQSPVILSLPPSLQLTCRISHPLTVHVFPVCGAPSGLRSFSILQVPHSLAYASLLPATPVAVSPRSFCHSCPAELWQGYNLTLQLSLLTPELQWRMEKRGKSVRECHRDPQLGPDVSWEAALHSPLSCPMDSQSTETWACWKQTTPNCLFPVSILPLLPSVWAAVTSPQTEAPRTPGTASSSLPIPLHPHTCDNLW